MSLAAIGTATRIVVEGSRALSAARDAYLAGKPIPEIVAAFAAETENRVDDKVAAELSEVLVAAARWAQVAALVAVKVSIRAGIWLPRVIARFRLAVDVIEDKAPLWIARLRVAADRLEGAGEQIASHAAQAARGFVGIAAALGRARGDHD